MRGKTRVHAGILGALLLPTAAAPARADDKSIADFYSRNKLTIAVGFEPGGTYDLYARVIARHLGQHIPGNPTIIVENVPGAGTRVLTNRLYNIGPQDGTIIGAPSQGIPTDQASGASGIQFDSSRFQWIGSPSDDVQVAWSWHTSRVKTFELAKQYEMLTPSTGPGSVTYSYPKVMNALLGTKFKLVTGYQGGAEMDTAVERGEVEGRVGEAWSSLRITKDWVATRQVNVLVQIAAMRSPDLPDVPLLSELAANDKERQALDFLSYAPAMGRPLFMPPNTPADKVAAIRKAFDETMKDEAFLAEAKNLHLDVHPTSGETLQKIAAATVAMPADVLATLQHAMQ
jgi:tripartite-type tricarboxylate transporter receptor subunit TctC